MLKVKMVLFLSLIAMVYGTNAYFSHRITVEVAQSYLQGKADFDREETENSWNWYVGFEKRRQEEVKRIKKADKATKTANNNVSVWDAPGIH